MLSCTRIGAIHSVVFGGFSPEALAGRLEDCDSKFIITADQGVSGKTILLKENVDIALKIDDFKKCVVVKRTGNKVKWNSKIDHWYDDLISSSLPICEPEKCSLKIQCLFCIHLDQQVNPKACCILLGDICIRIHYTSIYIRLS